MIRRVAGVLALVALACLPAGRASAAGDPTSNKSRYVVVYEASQRANGFSVIEETAEREQALGFDSRLRYRHAVKGFSATLSDDQVRRLERDPEVALVSPDRPMKATAVPLLPGGQVPFGISRIGSVINNTVHEPSGVAVAILDSGIDLTHPELNAESGANCITGGAASDDNGHGTHVAGVIGARNNGSGVVGVAPDTKLVSVKVLDRRGQTTISRVICGIDWVTARAAGLNIKVANVSLGGFAADSACTTDALHAAVCASTAAGVTYVVAAGNGGQDIGAYPLYVPATYPEVLTVTAMTDSDGQAGGLGPTTTCPDGSGETDDRYATFSNYALSDVDARHTIAAPGVCIHSTAMGGGYDFASGTSDAAPHVTGTVALCLNEGGREGTCAGLRPAEIIEKIRADAARAATASNGFAGDPNSPVGRYYGFLVSVEESTKPPPPPPHVVPQAVPPPDGTVSVRVLRVRSRNGRLYVTARLDEAGTLSARASVKATRRSSRPRRFRRIAKSVGGAATVRLVLRLDRRSTRVVDRSLRRGRRLIARIVLRATDTAGNFVRTRRAVRLRL